MLVQQAREIARQWVDEVASQEPGFCGAFFIGSINRKPAEAPFPPSSDIDIRIITEAPDPPGLNLFYYKNVVLEISYMAWDSIQSSEGLLGDYTLAVHFTTPNIISDPFGELSKINAVVSKDYARRKWVYKRCEHARELFNITQQWLNESDSFHEQVFAWLYPTSMFTHIVLVAGLQNPTVRKCFVASKEVLTRYGQLSLYESMLNLLGCVHMSRAQVEYHLKSCTEVFDVAKGFVKTPFFGATYITDYSRPISIDGSRELIESGDHREAVFWLIATQYFCQKALYLDAPKEVQDRYASCFRGLLYDLGISTFADLQQRNQQAKDLLPAVWEVAEAIIAANPEIID